MHRWHRPYVGCRQLPTKLSWVEVEHFLTLTAAEVGFAAGCRAMERGQRRR
jgi:hypothetical protein